MHWAGWEESTQEHAKNSPTNTSSLSQGLESPGAQNHKHYSSLVRNVTSSRAAAPILESRVCAAAGNGTLKADTSVGHRQKV